MNDTIETGEYTPSCGGCLTRTHDLTYIETAHSDGFACPTCWAKLNSLNITRETKRDLANR